MVKPIKSFRSPKCGTTYLKLFSLVYRICIMAFLHGVLYVTVLALLHSITLTAAKRDHHTEENQSANGFVLPPMTLQPLSDEQLKHHPRKHGRNAQHNTRTVSPPVTFKASDKWPSCSSLTTIRDQGQCGDCWAVSSASVLSDRWCIAKGKNLPVSALQVAGCTYPSYTTTQNCNAGGNMPDAYKRAAMFGFPTGGELNSNVGCVPYTISGAPQPISCAAACTNAAYTTPLANDTANFRIDSYWQNYNSNATMSMQPNIDANIAQMKDEIFNNGPITASIEVYTDFAGWKNTPATPYYAGPQASAGVAGLHGVRITGWGQAADGVSYWIIANSWGPSVGVNGSYFVKMGSNVIRIEQNISAPIIDMNASVGCSAATFCSAAIDQAVTLQYNNVASSQYLLQGACSLKVKTQNGKLVADGSATPVGAQFINVQTPVLNQMLYNGGLSLLNTAGIGGYNCAGVTGSVKVQCSGGTWSFTGSRAYAALPTGDTFAWTTVYPTYIQVSKQDSLSYSYRSFNFVPAYTLPTGTNITSFLNINATNAYVFAKDVSGNALTGVITWPPSNTTGNFAWATPLGTPSTLQTCV